MNTLSFIVLGLIQGFTEFFPVSSSGHLVLGQHILGLVEPQLLFDASLHIATLCAVIIALKHDILIILQELVSKIHTALLHSFRWRELFNTAAWKIILGTIPAVVVGIFFRDTVEHMFVRPQIVCINLLLTGTLLWLTRYGHTPVKTPVYIQKREIPSISWKRALIIGIAQACALAPGISRSGSTISVALLLGCTREDAGKFSFLLFIPAALGAFLLELTTVSEVPNMVIPIIIGAIAAFISGYGALVFLFKLLSRGNIHYFSWYCWAVAIIGLILL